MRDRTFLASVFYGWATYQWKRAAALAAEIRLARYLSYRYIYI